MTATTAEPVLLIERRGPVLVLRVNRPDKRNAINFAVKQALTSALDQAASDDRARCIVLTGVGDVAFIAGADIAEMVDRSPMEQHRAMREARIFDRSYSPARTRTRACAQGGASAARARRARRRSPQAS